MLIFLNYNRKFPILNIASYYSRILINYMLEAQKLQLIIIFNFQI